LYRLYEYIIIMYGTSLCIYAMSAADTRKWQIDDTAPLDIDGAGGDTTTFSCHPSVLQVYLIIFTRTEPTVAAPSTFNTAEAAKRLGVHRSTLLRWFAEKRIAEVRRDRNNWRVFTADDVRRIEREVGSHAGAGR